MEFDSQPNAHSNANEQEPHYMEDEINETEQKPALNLSSIIDNLLREEEYVNIR